MLADAKWSDDKLPVSVYTLTESTAALMHYFSKLYDAFPGCSTPVSTARGQLFLEWIDTVHLHGRHVFRLHDVFVWTERSL